MDTPPELLPPTAAALARAGALLRDGQLVAFPTETVYAVAADATSETAVATLRTAKGLTAPRPLTVYLPDAADADTFGIFDPVATLLADTCWAGPLTLIVPGRTDAGLAPQVTAGTGTVGLRVPGHPLARALLRAADRPLAVSSANRAGGLTPTIPLAVAEGLGGAVALILAGGRAAMGVDSTVVDASRRPLMLLRPGPFAEAELAGLIGQPLAAVDPAIHPPRRRNRLKTRIRLGALTVTDGEAVLAFGPDAFLRGGVTHLNLSPSGDLHEAAGNLFTMLRTLDKAGATAIAVMPVTERGIGIAINHRLREAAEPGD